MVATYKTKPVVVEAYQVDGSWANAEPLVGFINAYPPPGGASPAWWGSHLGGITHVPTPEGEAPAKPTDWVTRSSDGTYAVLDNATFAATYDFVAP